jgi:hypothetical protein
MSHPGAYLRLLRLMLACCLVLLAIPASAEAAADVTNADCSVQSVTMGKMTTWQIKGTAKISGIPAGIAVVKGEVRFMKKAKGAAQALEFTQVTQTLTVVMGGASIDTGWQTFTPAPGQGDEYSISATGSYQDAANNTVNLPISLSPVKIPIP